MAELPKFDILSFSEAWLKPSVTNDDLYLLSYNLPERKDRVADCHGGAIIYIKDHINYVRRHGPEPIAVECVWVELTLKHKHIIFDFFLQTA